MQEFVFITYVIHNNVIRIKYGRSEIACRSSMMYPGHLQNWLDYSHGLLIFLILALFWLREISQLFGLRAFPDERLEGMALHFTCWCIFTTLCIEFCLVENSFDENSIYHSPAKTRTNVTYVMHP